MKQGVFAQSALIAFAVPGQLNNPLCKCLPRGFGVTARSKADPGSVYGLPSLIERSSQNANGLGIEYAVSVVMEKLVHFNTPSQARQTRPAISDAMLCHPTAASSRSLSPGFIEPCLPTLGPYRDGTTRRNRLRTLCTCASNHLPPAGAAMPGPRWE